MLNGLKSMTLSTSEKLNLLQMDNVCTNVAPDLPPYKGVSRQCAERVTKSKKEFENGKNKSGLSKCHITEQ